VTATQVRPHHPRATTAPPLLGSRRAPRHIAVGLLLMLVFTLLFGALAVRTDPATPVLAVAQPVAAGQTISDQDLHVVRMVPDPGMQVVAAADRATVVGRTAAVPLAAGSLLSPTQVGAAQWPPAGESVIAVNVANARVPAGLGAGSIVTVLIGGASAGAAGVPAGTEEDRLPATVTATVVQVAPQDLAGATAVSLLLPFADALRLASADGPVSLVLTSPNR
jgi:hypothetical protein